VKNPWIAYTLVRLGLFFGLFALMALLEFNIYFAAIIAAVVSFAISTIFLDKQRNQLSEEIHNKFSKSGSTSQLDEAAEDSLTDSTEPETKP
jgi:cell division protein FtsL